MGFPLVLALVTAIWSPNSPWQVKALRNSAFDVFYGGAKGVSKSEVIMAGALRQIHHPAYKGLILREKLDETTEIADRMHRLFSKWPASRRPGWNGSDRVFRFPSRAMVRLGYCRVAGDVTLYQGREWSYIGFDEIANVADPKVIPELIKEIRSPVPELVRQFRCSGNPGYAGHAVIRKRYIVPCGDDGSRVHWERYKAPDGRELTLSRAYVPGTVFDNPIYASDPLYLAQLYSRPEKERRRLIFGDWSAAGGSYLDELAEMRHVVPAFRIPDNWQRAAGYDWGYAHNAVLVWGAFDPDGNLWVCDTVWMHRKKDREQAQQIIAQAPQVIGVVIRGGGDVLNTQEARVDGVIPSTQERFRECGLTLVRNPGTSDRAKNGTNLRDWLSWKGRGQNGEDAIPRMRFLDTPGNRRLLEQIESVVEDDDWPEYPLKADADPETGEGGDDGFDALMNLAGVRPILREAPHRDIDAFAPATLACMAEQSRRGRKVSARRGITLPGELAG